MSLVSDLRAVATSPESGIKKCNDGKLRFETDARVVDPEVPPTTEDREPAVAKGTTLRLTREVAPQSVPGQKWAVVVFVGPECSDKADHFAMSILGVFETIDDCKDFIQSLRGPYSTFNNYDLWIVLMNRFLQLPPPLTSDEPRNCLPPDRGTNRIRTFVGVVNKDTQTEPPTLYQTVLQYVDKVAGYVYKVAGYFKGVPPVIPVVPVIP